MGESNDELIDAIFALRDLDSDSIPINFLMPFDSTPLSGPGSWPVGFQNGAHSADQR